MKNQLIGSLASLLTAAGLTLAEPPASSPAPITTLPAKVDPSEIVTHAEPCHETERPKAPRVWFSAEHLLWRIKHHPLPVPLASAALEPFDSPNPGALGDPNTAILLGGDDVDAAQWRHGGRFTVGSWLGCEQRIGFEGSFFFLLKQTDRRAVSSDGGPDSLIVGFPFFDAVGQRTPDGLPGEAFIP